MTADACFEAYAVGLMNASVCTNLSADEATLRLNSEHPTGIESRWFISPDATFRGGEPHPAPCEQRDDCRHLLFHC